MFSKSVFLSRALTSRVLCLSSKVHFKTSFPSILSPSQKSSVRVIQIRSMASQNFPAQKQDTQPGKEHVMDPNPQFASNEYKPSNKLQVNSKQFIFFTTWLHYLIKFSTQKNIFDKVVRGQKLSIIFPIIIIVFNYARVVSVIVTPSVCLFVVFLHKIILIRKKFKPVNCAGKDGIGDRWRLGDRPSSLSLLCIGGCNCGLHICERSGGQRCSRHTPDYQEIKIS